MVFERIVQTALVDYLNKNNLLPEDQHRFIEGRSTLTQLLNPVEDSIRAAESSKVTHTAPWLSYEINEYF